MSLTRARQRALRRARPMWSRKQRICCVRDYDFQFARALRAKKVTETKP